MNDSELVQGLRRREPAAMQWLCECYLPSLWRFVYTRVNRDSHLAEDITSEAILAMLTTIQSDANAEILNPAGWLRTVADRRATDHFRAAARVRCLVEDAAGISAASEQFDPARHHELEESRAEVRQIMDDMPDQHRLVLEWKYLETMSVREIAARWEMTEKAVESILFRARRDFRERLKKPDADEPSRNGKGTTNPQSSIDEATKQNASY